MKDHAQPSLQFFTQKLAHLVPIPKFRCHCFVGRCSRGCLNNDYLRMGEI
jgi:hypothetical protein